MKLKELISRVNKHPSFKEEASVIQIAEDMGFSSSYYDEHELVAYYVSSWHCTDSYVGYRVYFLKDEPVAVSSQLGRKSDENFEWVSKEAYYKVRDYILSLQQNDEQGPYISIANMDEDVGDFYKIDYTSQLFEYHKTICMYQGDKCSIISIHQDDKVTIKIGDENKLVSLKKLDFPYNII